MIDYTLIGQAILFYKMSGFRELDVPWLVKEDAINITMPPGCETMKIAGVDHLFDDRHLVASGEQSFIELMLDGSMPVGDSVCCTPCFRDEKVLSDITRQYFLKVELIKYRNFDNISKAVKEMVELASSFIGRWTKIKVVETGKDMYDLVDVNGIELGSYGHRQYGSHEWIYGTGLAEPRCSISMSRG